METNSTGLTLDYTGERMVPEKADPFTFWEHIYRYRFACAHVKEKLVLDIACGEGYGTAAIAGAGATGVIGVDVSAEACAHASKKYGLDIRVGDAQKIPLASQSVDLIVSFETIEHLSQPHLLLDECVRVLKPEGQIIISTPNRDAYREEAPHNPYHLNELSEEDFINLLNRRFKKIQLYTQRPKSAAWWSFRTLSSEQSPWQKLRGFKRLRRLLQRICCREIADPLALEKARENPVSSISARPQTFSHIANPFAIRPRSAFSRETPVYIIAVASL